MSINTWTVSICHRTIPRVRMTHLEKWGDGSSVHKPLNKQSQEGCNLFLRLHCELIWISPVDMVSGFERDRGRTLTADVMLRSNNWWGVAGLAAKFTGNTNTVISLCTLLLLPIVACKKKKREVKFPPLREGRRSHLAPDFCACSVLLVPCLLSLWDRTYSDYR